MVVNILKGGDTFRAFNIDLQQGWNALLWHYIGSMRETVTSETWNVTETLHVGNPARLRWVIDGWGGWSAEAFSAELEGRSLTRRPPVVTIQNQTGHTINNVFVRNTGTAGWGLSILGATGGGVLAGSFVHGEGLAVNMAYLPAALDLGGERFDIRVDDVQGNTYVRSNLLITADMNLPFTPAHRP